MGGPDPSAELLDRVRRGDEAALDALIASRRAALRAWAARRLPAWARDLADTSDLVQETVLHTFSRLDRFEYRGPGSLDAYLRGAFMNRLRDEFRRATRGHVFVALDPALPDEAAPPDEVARRVELLDRYDRALAELPAPDRELIVCRFELGMTYQEVAAATGRATEDAARMAVTRAFVRLAERLELPEAS